MSNDSERELQELQTFRQNLMRAHSGHDEQASLYLELLKESPKEADDSPQTRAVRAAWMGHCMAATYSYGLAAALRLVEQTGSPALAGAVASQVAGLIADGDDDDLNHDVTP